MTSIGDIDGIGPKTLEKLEDNGIDSVDKLASADIEDITSAGMSSSRAKDIKYKAKQNTIQIQSGLEVEEEYDSRNSIDSSISSLNEYTEGGIADGEIVAVYGSDGSGKTQLAFQLAVDVIENSDGPVIYLETERQRFQPPRIKEIASSDDVLDEIYRIKAYDLEQQYSAIKKITEEFDDVGLIIIDSLTARFRLTNEFDDRSSLSARSSEIGKHILAVEDMVDHLKCPCLVTGQVYDAPTQYDSGDMLWGGSVLKHSIIYRIYMKQSTGETHEVTVEQHPSTGDNSFHININDEGIEEV